MKHSEGPESLGSDLEQKTITLLRWVFLVGGVGTSLLGWVDGSSGFATSWDNWGIPITSFLYAVSGVILWWRPRHYVFAVLLSFFPTAIYQQGVLYWGIQFPGLESYASAASGGSFFPVVYLVLFIALPRYAWHLSWCHCGAYFLQALYHWMYFQGGPYLPGQEEGLHLLVSVLCSHPVYILALRYIVTLREQLHLAHETSFQSKAQFLGMLSHEIRNMLQGLVTAIELLEFKSRSLEEARIFGRLHVLTAQFQTYLRDVHELTRLENPALAVDVVAFEAGDFLQGVCDAWQLRMSRQQLGLSLAIAPSLQGRIVHSDPERLRQVLDNLLGNALKYTPSGEVRIEAGLDTDDASCWWIDVTDTGVGIDPKYHAKIFEPYVRLRPEGIESSDGSGLGLAIVARLAQALAGAISVKSAAGNGATFRLRLPLDSSH